MSRFEEMEAFVRVVEDGTITAAAERLGIAKSAVSRRLSQLESRLGVQLLRRTTRTHALTPEGRRFHERASRLLDELHRSEEEVADEAAQLRGTLRIAAPLSFGHLHLSSAVLDFIDEHPHLEFDLDFDDRQVDLLREGFDLGLRIASSLPDSTFLSRRLAAIRHVVCASPSYVEDQGEPRAPVDLLDHRCLVYANNPQPGVWRFRGPGQEWSSVHVESSLRASSGEFLTQAAVAGQGIAMEPDFIVYREIEAGRLITLFPGLEWSPLELWALYPPTRYVPRRVRAFVDFLSERYAGVPYWQECLSDAASEAG